MEIAFEKTKETTGKTILRVKGDLDSYDNSNDFKRALEELFDAGDVEIVLDFDSVGKINSFGTGKILMFYRRLDKAGGNLYIKTPLRGMVAEVFENLKLDKLLKEYK